MGQAIVAIRPNKAPEPSGGLAALLARAHAEPEAFSALYGRYYPRIFGYIMRNVMNVSVAEDIVAETFMRALKSLRGFRGQADRFEGWLYRIATNVMLDHFRKCSREQRLVDSAAAVAEMVARDAAPQQAASDRLAQV